jgi:hypothetical protein
MSLDGFVAGPGQSADNPLGIGGMRLHEWVFPLTVWRAKHGLEGGEVNESSPIFPPPCSASLRGALGWREATEMIVVDGCRPRRRYRETQATASSCGKQYGVNGRKVLLRQKGIPSMPNSKWGWPSLLCEVLAIAGRFGFHGKLAAAHMCAGIISRESLGRARVVAMLPRQVR